MKQYTHAWIAMMAVKRLEMATMNEADKPYAASLVKWFKGHKDDVIPGAWYPDAIIKDMASSHILKMKPDPEASDVKWRKLPDTYGLFVEGKKNAFYKQNYRVTMGNLPDRCEALTHSLVDNLKMNYSEEKDSAIIPKAHYIAAIFFMLSHYIADAHMPLHCDARQYSEKLNVHGKIEADWDNRVKRCYPIDSEFKRFHYDKLGYPQREKEDPVLDHIESQLSLRPFDSTYGPGNQNTWDFMSAVTQYSYLTSYELIPNNFDIVSGDFKTLIALISKPKFEEFSKVILMDAVDSVAKVWFRAWRRYSDWKGKSSTTKK